MNHDSITRMIEQATEQEYHQFLAGAQRVIVLEDNRLRLKMAEGQRKEELGEPNDDNTGNDIKDRPTGLH